VFRRNLVANETELVSREGTTGAVGDANSYRPALSADGRYVAFRSDAENLSSDDAATSDVFARDMIEKRILLVSRASGANGSAANGDSEAPALSGDGRFVAFPSQADNLSAEDNDVFTNVFVRELAPGLPPPPPPPPDLGGNEGHGGHGGDGGPADAGAGHAGGAHTGDVAGDGAHAGHGIEGSGQAGQSGASGGQRADDRRRKGPGHTAFAARRQRIDRLIVASTLHARGTLVVEGRVVVQGRAARAYAFSKVRRSTPAHRLNIFRPRLARRAQRAVSRALRQHQAVKAVITVTGIDQAGNRNRVRKTIRLLPARRR